MKTVYREGLRTATARDAGHLRRAFQLLLLRRASGRCTWSLARHARRAPGLPVSQLFRACCATTAATAGSCCTCSVSRRQWARSFLGGDTAGLEVLDAHTHYGPHATSLRMSDVGYRNRNQVGDPRLGEQPRGLHARPAPCDRHAASALCQQLGVPRWRSLAAAERQPAADRERVLQLHPSQARGAFGRVAQRGAAARRRGVRRDARAGCQRVRSGGREPEQAAVPRGLRGLLPAARQPAHRNVRAGRARRQPPAGGAARTGAGPGAGARRPVSCRCRRGRRRSSTR